MPKTSKAPIHLAPSGDNLVPKPVTKSPPKAARMKAVRAVGLASKGPKPDPVAKPARVAKPGGKKK